MLPGTCATSNAQAQPAGESITCGGGAAAILRSPDWCSDMSGRGRSGVGRPQPARWRHQHPTRECSDNRYKTSCRDSKLRCHGNKNARAQTRCGLNRVEVRATGNEDCQACADETNKAGNEARYQRGKKSLSESVWLRNTRHDPEGYCAGKCGPDERIGARAVNEPVEEE